jgi:ATP-dependent helicase/nuclease subunit B
LTDYERLTQYNATLGMAPAAVRSALAAGCTLVTATRRLARALKADYARHQPAAGWTTPDIVPWAAWVRRTFQEARDFGMLSEQRACLDTSQAIAVWEEIFAGDEIAETLLMPAGAAEGCREAWRLAHEWQLPWPALQARAGEDGRVFLRLAARYQRRLDALGCVDEPQLPAIVAAALTGRAGPEVFFAGFETWTPAQAGVVEALGARVRTAASPRHAAAPTLAAHIDSRRELAAAVAWARRRLDADPAARLAIVVPDLETQAPFLEDLLDEALCPGRLLPGRGGEPRPWNVSLGQPLAEAPVVAAAFLAFGLTRTTLELAAVSRLLRSPFFAGAGEEGGNRARLEAWLRANAPNRIGADSLVAWLEGHEHAPSCRRLAEGVRGLLAELRGGARRRRPAEWAAAWTRALRHMGWPGDAPPDSPTWQTLQAWAALLDSFSHLDAVSGPLALNDAMARLRRTGGEQRFQPETPDVPVQVLGLLETTGLEFDGLWVSGMHDGTLPAPLRPCPLLPASLQREYGMPRACPDTELAMARRLVRALACAAPEVRFSYPLARQDEPLRASPVVTAFPPPAGDPPAVRSIAAEAFASRRLESLPDDRAPGVTGAVAGGTGLLAAQSACPFKAFAVHRLAARELEAPAAGVDGSSRGSFVHAALRLLWEELRDFAGLAALEGAARAARIHAALQRAAGVVLARQPPGLVRIEIAEAALRINELLQLELARTPFEIAQIEQRVEVGLGPLRIAGQVDRVDRVADGLVVIDYKTGAAEASDWLSDRPAEPQMPLYALAFEAELAGLVYASLKPGAVELRGVVRSADVLGAAMTKRRAPSDEEWAEALAEWRRVLAGLAHAFASGDARVDPVQPRRGGTCEWCHLSILCRRDELWRAGVLGDD